MDADIAVIPSPPFFSIVVGLAVAAVPLFLDLGKEGSVALQALGRDLALSASPDIVSNPTDIVLTLDRSDSLEGAPMESVKAGAKTFIDILSESTGGAPDAIGSGSRIGIVSFNQTATADTQLIPSVAALKEAVDALDASGSTNHAAAFSAAMQLFDPSPQTPR